MSRRCPFANFLFLALILFACLPAAYGQLFGQEQTIGSMHTYDVFLSENRMYVHKDVIYLVWTRYNNTNPAISQMRRSLDGGYTWLPVQELGPGTLATLHFAGGIVYALMQRTELTTRIADLRRSTDGGASFDQPREVFRQLDFYGKLDMFANGNAVLLYWTDSNAYYRRSADAGETFANPQMFPEPGWDMTFAADGNNIYVSYYSISARVIFVRRSPNNGETFLPVTQIPASSASKQSITITDGKVLLLWSGTLDGGNRPDILLASSADQTQTFSTPINLSRTASRSENDPRISVSGSNVMVVFNDESAVFLARSTNGGANFFDAVDVSGPSSANRAQVRIYNSHVYVVYEASIGVGDRRTRYHVSTDLGATFLPRQVIFRRGVYPQLELINNVPLISANNHRDDYGIVLFRRSRPLPLRGPVLKKLLVQEPELFF